MDDSAAQQQLKALSATAREHLVDMLVEALHPVLIDKMKDQWPVASAAVTEKVQAGKNTAVAALATTKQRLQEAQSVALAGTGAGPISLKIVGVGGLNQIEARDKYLTSREKLIKNHMATVKAKEQRALAVAKVATGDTSGVDPRALTLQELSLEEGKYDIASDGRGKIVLDNKTEVTTVPVPKELIQPMTTSRSTILADWYRWTQKDSVIKRFPLIVPEIRYMVSAVDPIEAMHMLPPDRLNGWVEKEEFEKQLGLPTGTDTTEIIAAYNDERQKQWDDFYALATCQPTMPRRGQHIRPSFMLGIRRTLEQGDKWSLHLTQTEFVDGLVGTWKQEVAEAGFATKQPSTPIPPGTFLTAAHDVEPEEYKEIEKKGYKAVCGSLLWLARFCHCEIACAVSLCCRVMGKPTREAWNCCMQIIAWLRDNKTIGVKFSASNNEHGLVCTSDASNKPDPKDLKCQGSHTIQWYGGPIAHLSKKLPRIGHGSGANEFMELRIAAARVMKFRHFFKELRLMEVIPVPTKIYVDNEVAINWQKTGKMTPGNHYADIDYFQPREWEQDGHIKVLSLDTRDMITDLGTKAVSEKELDALFLVMKGHKKWVIKHPRNTMLYT